MKNTNQNDLKATQSMGVTEMQITQEKQEMEDWIDTMENANIQSFYDLTEQNGTLIYYQCDSEGNEIKAEDY